MILSELNWSVNDHEASSLSQYRRNMGNRQAYLQAALDKLASHPGCQLA